MFREMRRNDKLLANEETVKVLERCTSGVLAVAGDDGYPYAVPLSYTVKDDRLFIHCAKEGHKIDAIKKNDKVSFCIIEKDEVVQERFTTLFRSVIIFGRARILTEDAEKRDAMVSLVEKYSRGFAEEGRKKTQGDWDRFCVIEVKIEHMTGKASKELMNNKV